MCIWNLVETAVFPCLFLTLECVCLAGWCWLLQSFTGTHLDLRQLCLYSYRLLLCHANTTSRAWPQRLCYTWHLHRYTNIYTNKNLHSLCSDTWLWLTNPHKHFSPVAWFHLRIHSCFQYTCVFVVSWKMKELCNFQLGVSDVYHLSS